MENESHACWEEWQSFPVSNQDRTDFHILSEIWDCHVRGWSKWSFVLKKKINWQFKTFELHSSCETSTSVGRLLIKNRLLTTRAALSPDSVVVMTTDLHESLSARTHQRSLPLGVSSCTRWWQRDKNCALHKLNGHNMHLNGCNLEPRPMCFICPDVPFVLSAKHYF